MNSVASYTFDHAVQPAEYDTFVKSQLTCNLLQSSAWAKVKHTWGHHLTALRDKTGNILATGLVLVRPLKLGFTMWYLPHGPILDYEATGAAEILGTYLNHLAAFARKTRCAFVKVDPPLALQAAPRENLTGQYNPRTLAYKEVFETQGYIHQGFPLDMHATLQPRFTTATMAPPAGKTLLEVVPKRTRRFVKDAQAHYVEVRRVGPEGLDDFLEVISHTEEAKGVHLRNRDYFQTLFDVYGDDVSLYLAYLDLDGAITKYRAKIAQCEEALARLGENAKQKRQECAQQIASSQKQVKFLESRRKVDRSPLPLAGCLSILYGSGFEMLYAGMNREYSKITAQDLIYVKSMTEAFNHGARYCSIGGIEGTLDDGLLKFKSHFSPLVIEKLGEFDLPVHGLVYRAVRFYLAHR